MQVKRLIERFISKEEKDKFLEAMSSRNIAASKYIVPLVALFEIGMIILFIVMDRFNGIKNKCYFSSYIILLFFSVLLMIFIYRHKRRPFSAKAVNVVCTAYVSILIAWSMVISVLDSGHGMQFIVYLTIIMSCSSAVRLLPKISLPLQAVSGAVMIIIVSTIYDYGFDFTQSINVFVFIVISMIISINYHNRELDEFRRKTLIEESNDQLIGLNSELNAAYEKMVRMATEDTLTGLKNRLTLNKNFEELISSCNAGGKLLNCAILDLDNFKSINDTCGHLLGDEALKKTAFILRENSPSGTAYRYGGEEFVIIDGDLSAEKFYSVIEKIRLAIAETTIEGIDNSFTVSAGICSGLVTGENVSSDKFLAKADAALYQSKQDGKNRITVINV